MVDPRLLPLYIEQIRLQEYLQCAAAVPLIYDAVVTMDREVKYFWKAPRKPVDFIYFTNRYIGIFGAVANFFIFTLSANLEECNFALWSFSIANWLTVILTDYILTIRVLALYSQDRILAICLHLFLALEAVVKLAIVVYENVFEHVAVGGAGDIILCTADRFPSSRLGIVSWSVQLAYAVILMVLALYKAAEYWKLSAGFKGFTLIKVLIEDQVLYFMSVILVSVLAMVEFKLSASNGLVVYVLDALSNPSFLCILGSRMLLNLKEAGERGQNEGTSLVVPSMSVSDMEFCEPPVNVEASQAEKAAGA